MVHGYAAGRYAPQLFFHLLFLFLQLPDLLVQHPHIADIAIVGLPSEKTGEMACAVIVPREGHQPDVASLRAFLEEKRLAKYKMPEQVVLRDALPRNAIGKVLKVQLRQELLAS